jgi:hypothetical protein
LTDLGLFLTSCLIFPSHEPLAKAQGLVAVLHLNSEPGVGNKAPVALQIAVPVLGAADAAILHLEPPNAAFELVVGASKLLAVVALHQVWA